MKPKVAFLVLFIALVGVRAKAQSDSITRKFDEFERVGHCDLGARLDNYAIQLQNTPGSTAHIVAYGPDVEGPGSGRSRLGLIKDYLVNIRGLPKSRIKVIYAGRNSEVEEPRVQLWITPAGAAPVEPHRFETDVNTFKGLFAIKEFEEEYIDIFYPDEMGPGIGLATNAAFADMLHQQNKAIAYIVAYHGEDAVPGAARRFASDQLDDLKAYKIDASRIKTIFAGVRKKTTLHLWILPPGEPAPANDAGPEEPPKKNVLITSQGDLILGNPENQRAVFNRMLEVLRAQPTLKAFVIVTMEAAQPERQPDPDVADLPKLIQKWRDELTNTHKIRPDRFIVVFTTAPPDEGGGYLQLWVVPPGQPFPDPNDEADEADKTEENLTPDAAPSLGSRLGALIRGN
jgi:hypothetical protein